MSVDANAEWDALLTRFEAELDQPGLTLPLQAVPTTPLPAEYRERAEAVYARQQQRTLAIQQEMADTAAQLNALDRVPVEHARAGVYIERDA